MPLTNNRPRTNTTYGSHRSLSASLQSLLSNRQMPFSLPVKKASNDALPILPKREQKASSPNPLFVKNDYQHHYQNAAQLDIKAQAKSENTSSEDEKEFQPHTTNLKFEHSSVCDENLLIWFLNGFLSSSRLKIRQQYHQNTIKLIYTQTIPIDNKKHHQQNFDQQLIVNQ